MFFLHELLDEVVADHWQEICVANCGVLSLGNENVLFLLFLLIHFALATFNSFLGFGFFFVHLSIAFLRLLFCQLSFLFLLFQWLAELLIVR